jgi:hypothetical protein
MHENLIILDEIASLIRWHEIALWFFFKTLDGTVVFKNTYMLSPYINTGPFNSTPIDRSIYLILRMSSEAILESTNYEP